MGTVKETKVGEEIIMGAVRLKCITQKEELYGSCKGCFFETWHECSLINGKLIGDCTNDRKDKQDVIFIEVRE